MAAFASEVDTIGCARRRGRLHSHEEIQVACAGSRQVQGQAVHWHSILGSSYMVEMTNGQRAVQFASFDSTNMPDAPCLFPRHPGQDGATMLHAGSARPPHWQAKCKPAGLR